jgi:ankyrin repeat protein
VVSMLLVLASSCASSQHKDNEAPIVEASSPTNLQAIDDAAPYLKDGQLLEEWKKLSRDYYNRAIAKYLNQGGSITARTVNGSTLLHIAAPWCTKALATQILAKGADVSARNNFGETALHLAAGASNQELVEFLIAEGADVNAQDEAGKTPLSKTKNRAVIQFLKLNGAI